MTAKRQKKKQKNSHDKQSALQHRPDPSIACFALHPSGQFVAVAVGGVVRINRIRGASATDQITHQHAAPIRAVSFDDSGKFLSAGDEKVLNVWDTGSWQQLQSIQSPKKVSTAVFSNDGNFAVFADKFGDVLTANLRPDISPQTERPAVPLLGHLCSIITSLAFSPDGRQLVSTDQDCKVRISTMPSDLHKGAHSIQSICMGHKAFAKCCAFLNSKNGAEPLLLSGGGDSTIRSWQYLAGKQLDCFTCTTSDAQDDAANEEPVSSVTGVSPDGGVPAASAAAQSDAAKQHLSNEGDADMGAAEPSYSAADGGNPTDADDPPQTASGHELDEGSELEEEADDDGADDDGADDDGADGQEQNTAASDAEGSRQPAVLSISTHIKGSTVAAAVEGRDTILILHCDAQSGKLSHQQDLQLPGLTLPTQVQFDWEGRLWAVGGPLPGSEHAVCIGVASLSNSSSDSQWQSDDSVLPEDVKAALESREAGSNPAEPASAATSNQQQVNQQLRKRVYSDAEREARKRNRNDMKTV